MAITWNATAKCDYYGGCKSKTPVTATAVRARQINFTAPDGWQIQYRGCYDSYPDVTEPDLPGEDIRVLCPEHREK